MVSKNTPNLISKKSNASLRSFDGVKAESSSGLLRSLTMEIENRPDSKHAYAKAVRLPNGSNPFFLIGSWCGVCV